MIRDRLARDHVDLLRQTYEGLLTHVPKLDERLAAGDESVSKVSGHAGRSLMLVNAMYSLGASVEVIREQAARIPRVFITTQDRIFKPHRNGSSVLDLLDAAALVALFSDRTGAEQLIEAIARFEVEDFLIDSFVGSVVDFRTPSEGLQMDVADRNLGVKKPSLYAGQREAAKLAMAGDSRGAADELARYVGSWFGAHASSGFAWTSPDRAGRSYTGHWCFTAAATAKVFGIDDAALEHHDRYPWDLAHPSS